MIVRKVDGTYTVEGLTEKEMLTIFSGLKLKHMLAVENYMVGRSRFSKGLTTQEKLDNAESMKTELGSFANEFLELFNSAKQEEN